MRRVRPADAPEVAWTLAWSLNPARRATIRRVLAVATWPIWVATVLLLPGFVHADRKVVVRLARRSRAQTALVAVGFLGAAAVLFALVGALLGLLASLAPWWLALPGMLLVCGWLFTAGTTLLAVTMTDLAESQRREAEARRVHSPDQLRVDQAARRGAQWSLDSAVSLLPRGGLALISEHVRRTVPPGQTITVQASTERHVVVYRRYGFAPLATAPTRLLATA